jgi:polysaccharide deacetylase 2 family uncharacterized protein YibQ
MRPEESPSGEPGSNYLRRLYIIFAALAMVSCLGLDYLASRRGERSYLFSPFPPAKPGELATIPLTHLAVQVLAEGRVAEADIRRGRSEDGRPRLSVRLPIDAYQGLAASLRSAFQQHGVNARVEEHEEAGQTTYSWSVLRGETERLDLEFTCVLPPPPEKEEAPRPAPPRTAAPDKIVAIIIDDMGNSLDALQEVCDLDMPLTISVLPESPYAQETAQTAHDHDLEVMLHLPGESLNHQEGNPSPMAIIRADMPPAEIRAFVLDSLGKVPYAAGVNNHMGSKITQEPKVMSPILDVLKERGLFFLDSRTGDHSIAYDLARRMGLRSTYRNVFLDSKVGLDYSKKRLVELFKLAQKKGRAVAIGHPFPETLQALRDELPLLRKYGVRLVPASRVIPE